MTYRRCDTHRNTEGRQPQRALGGLDVDYSFAAVVNVVSTKAMFRLADTVPIDT